MEGFLLKKARGESGFGRRNWKRRWFVLEDQRFAEAACHSSHFHNYHIFSLKYFEDFNLRSGQVLQML
jgi:hypothetical protein